MVMTEVLLLVAFHHTSSRFSTTNANRWKKVKRTENGVPKWGQSHKTTRRYKMHQDTSFQEPCEVPWDSLRFPGDPGPHDSMRHAHACAVAQVASRRNSWWTRVNVSRFHWGFTEVSLLAKSLSVASIVGEHWTYWTNDYKDCNLNAVQHFALTSMLVSYCQMLNGTVNGFIKLGECSPIQNDALIQTQGIQGTMIAVSAAILEQRIHFRQQMRAKGRVVPLLALPPVEAWPQTVGSLPELVKSESCDLNLHSIIEPSIHIDCKNCNIRNILANSGTVIKASACAKATFSCCTGVWGLWTRMVYGLCESMWPVTSAGQDVDSM